MKTAKIRIGRVVGFCCSAAVLVEGEVVHVTRDRPYGMDHAAYADAEAWCAANGYEVQVPGGGQS